ncbi:MAG: hypothetical protein CVV53_03300 [Spirochaetae bacterium HGW-Spirochaetae-9]|nr:MAG: hypothetical protein CVV53_03300 [Spirochaetae bacterium HGW-Spirochaetae-9]
MIKNRKSIISAILLAVLLIFSGAQAGAQEFGFGDGAAAAGQPAATGATLGGEVSFSLLAFPGELIDGDFSNSTVLPATKISVEASGAKADAFIGMKLDKDILATSPADILDEAWLRVFAGQATIQGGILRATWGRADSLSVLDVLNPRNLSDLTLRDESDRKLAVPMLRLTQSLGERLSADFVYLPWFEGDRIARTGLWVPAQLKPFAAATINMPATTGLDYGQAGLRITGSLKGIDLGAQYFYGRLTTPFMDTTDAATFLYFNPAQVIDIGWNPYHQVGADAAFVAAGFNVRLEAGVNLTEDAAGTDTLVYNQHAVWSAGFDRDLFASINLNLQAMGKVRLNHDKIANPLDIESGTTITSTQVAALLSRSFMQEKLKIELLGLLGVEKLDYMVEPGLVLAIGDAEIALRGRYFGGDAEGDFGQFNDRSYVSLSSKYAF